MLIDELTALVETWLAEAERQRAALESSSFHEEDEHYYTAQTLARCAEDLQAILNTAKVTP